MLQINHYTKQYAAGGPKAVDDLNLHIRPGEIFGFVFLNEKGVPFSTPMFIAVAVFAALDIAMYIFLLSPAVEKRFHKIGR